MSKHKLAGAFVSHAPGQQTLMVVLKGQGSEIQVVYTRFMNPPSLSHSRTLHLSNLSLVSTTPITADTKS
jgi:hypothetical protein